jgi:hypothetical protein
MFSRTFKTFLLMNRIVKYCHQIFEFIAHYDIGYTSPSFGQNWFNSSVISPKTYVKI